MKRGGGRRLYRPADVELLRGIRDLLQNAGYTIKGVQKILREQGVEQVKLAGELVAARANQASADGAAASQTAFAQSTGRAHPAQNRWRTRRLRRTAKNRGRAQGERAAREARGIAQLASRPPGIWARKAKVRGRTPVCRFQLPAGELILTGGVARAAVGPAHDGKRTRLPAQRRAVARRSGALGATAGADGARAAALGRRRSRGNPGA